MSKRKRKGLKVSKRNKDDKLNPISPYSARLPTKRIVSTENQNKPFWKKSSFWGFSILSLLALSWGVYTYYYPKEIEKRVKLKYARLFTSWGQKEVGGRDVASTLFLYCAIKNEGDASFDPKYFLVQFEINNELIPLTIDTVPQDLKLYAEKEHFRVEFKEGYLEDLQSKRIIKPNESVWGPLMYSSSLDHDYVVKLKSVPIVFTCVDRNDKATSFHDTINLTPGQPVIDPHIGVKVVPE